MEGRQCTITVRKEAGETLSPECTDGLGNSRQRLIIQWRQSVAAEYKTGIRRSSPGYVLKPKNNITSSVRTLPIAGGQLLSWSMRTDKTIQNVDLQSKLSFHRLRTTAIPRRLVESPLTRSLRTVAVCSFVLNCPHEYN